LEKHYWKRKQKFAVITFSRSLNLTYSTFHVGTTTVGIDRQLCTDESISVNVQSYWSNSSRERAIDPVHAPPPRVDVAHATISISILCPAACYTALTLYFDKQTLCAIFYLEFEKFDDKRRRENAP